MRRARRNEGQMRPGKQQIAYHEAGHAVIARVLGVAVLRVGVLFPALVTIRVWLKLPIRRS